MSAKWDQAAALLAQGILAILTENGIPPLPENLARIQVGSREFLEAIRAAVKEEMTKS